MSDKQLPELNKEDFKLNGEGALEVVLPKKPSVSDEDVEAQLFSYVAHAGKHSGIHSIDDLDDDWVKENFPGTKNIEQLKEDIKVDLVNTINQDFESTKFQRCADVLVSRLEGEIPEDILHDYLKESRNGYAIRLKAAGMSKASYMQREGISSSEFEQRLHDDVVFNLRFNMALDLLADQLGETVADEDLTKFLQVADPENFIQEATETGKLEEARKAATRVKVMRSLIENAVFSEE